MGGGGRVEVPSDRRQLGTTVEAGIASHLLSNPAYSTPFGSVTYSSSGEAGRFGGVVTPRPQVNINLPPEVQERINRENRLANLTTQLQQDALGRIAQNYSGDNRYLNLATLGPLQRALETQNLPDITGGGDFAAERQRLEGELNAQQRRLVDERFRGQEEKLRQRLVNQGLRPGSQAYDEEIRQFEDTRNRAYQEAQTAAFQGAGQEQQRLTQAQQTARNQLFGERQQQAEFGGRTRQTALNELLLQRDRPLQEFQSLRGVIAAPNVPEAPTYSGSSIAAPNAAANAATQSQARSSNPFLSFLGPIGNIAGSVTGSLFGGGNK